MGIKSEIENKTRKLVIVANAKFKTNLVLSDILYRRMPVTYAYAIYDAGNFYIKYSTIRLEKYPKEMLKDTIPHEVAHLIGIYLSVLTSRKGDTAHGPLWKSMCLALGGIGEIYSKHRLTPRYYQYIDSGGHIQYVTLKYHNEMQNNYRVLNLSNGETIKAADFSKDIY